MVFEENKTNPFPTPDSNKSYETTNGNRQKDQHLCQQTNGKIEETNNIDYGKILKELMKKRTKINK